MYFRVGGGWGRETRGARSGIPERDKGATRLVRVRFLKGVVSRASNEVSVARKFLIHARSTRKRRERGRGIIGESRPRATIAAGRRENVLSEFGKIRRPMSTRIEKLADGRFEKHWDLEKCAGREKATNYYFTRLDQNDSFISGRFPLSTAIYFQFFILKSKSLKIL